MYTVDRLEKCEVKLKSLMTLSYQESSTGILRERDRLLERAYNLLLIGSEIDKEKPPTEIVEKGEQHKQEYNYNRYIDWRVCPNTNSSVVETLVNYM